MGEINLDDLSEKDLECLMQQAKERLEEERIRQNAKAEYRQKKAQLLESATLAVYSLGTFDETAQKDFYKRFISMANYLYKGLTFSFSPKIYNKDKVSVDITTKDEWKEYQRIVNGLKNAICRIMQYEEV